MNILYLLFLILFISALHQSDAQFSKYVPPNEVNYTYCTLTNGYNKSYCPVGTYCVDSLRATNIWYPGMTGLQTILAELTAPGCCPYNTSPCFSPTLKFSVPGCCGQNKTCCFSKFSPNKFLGCVDSIHQCCGDTICPVGYSCCYQDTFSLYYCCPGLTACQSTIDLNASTTSNSTVISRTPNIYFTGTNPLLQPKPYSECLMPAINETTPSLPWPEDMVIPCGNLGSLCLNATEDCISRNGINLSLDPTNNITDFIENGMMCCTKNTTICPMTIHKNHQTIIGCADESKGESCCASQICPASYKCCHYFPPQDNSFAFNTIFSYNAFYNMTIPTPNPLNETALVWPSTDICCPEGTFCCAALINLDNSLDPKRRRIWSYCGRDENCLSVATFSESLQQIPMFGGFLPDYIEQPPGADIFDFWQDPIVRFSNGINNYCNNCNSFTSSSCTNCVTSCQDQCQLDITGHC